MLGTIHYAYIGKLFSYSKTKNVLHKGIKYSVFLSRSRSSCDENLGDKERLGGGFALMTQLCWILAGTKCTLLMFELFSVDVGVAGKLG